MYSLTDLLSSSVSSREISLSNRGSGNVIEDDTADDGIGSDASGGVIGRTGTAAAGGVGAGPEHEQNAANKKVSNQKLKRFAFISTHPQLSIKGFRNNIIPENVKPWSQVA
ncbi:MAG: hypothetical protein KAT53_02125 [Dehalococcoidia bacterium]|nr:hypothetical protein [Dehalococcoidia bacterium]